MLIHIMEQIPVKYEYEIVVCKIMLILSPTCSWHMTDTPSYKHIAICTEAQTPGASSIKMEHL